jgi:hypothetical protein
VDEDNTNTVRLPVTPVIEPEIVPLSDRAAAFRRREKTVAWVFVHAREDGPVQCERPSA